MIAPPLPPDGRRRLAAVRNCTSLVGSRFADCGLAGRKAAGSVVLRKVPAGDGPCAEDVWGPPRPEMGVMRGSIKEQFDPQNSQPGTIQCEGVQKP